MKPFDPYAYAQREGLEVLYRRLPYPVLGLYFRLNSISVVVLHDRLTPVEERCILTEELGHHRFTVGQFVRPYYCLAEALRVSREEARILRWAADRLVDEGQLWRLARQGMSLAELAEHLQVTPKIIAAKTRRLVLYDG